MKVALLLAGCLVAFGCSGGGLNDAQVTLIEAGEGDDIVPELTTDAYARWTYLVEPGDGSHSTAEDTWYDGLVQLPNGIVANRYVSSLQVVYQVIDDDGIFYWGSSDGDLMEKALCTVLLPLRLNREWVTGDADRPDWYRFKVDAVEPIETPAGRFMAARVSQLNTKTQQVVSRWYAQGVGMVQRYTQNDNGTMVHTILLRYVDPKEAP